MGQDMGVARTRRNRLLPREDTLLGPRRVNTRQSREFKKLLRRRRRQRRFKNEFVFYLRIWDFFKDPRQNSGTVPVPKYKVSTLYSGTELGNDMSGTQCLNTAPFFAGARVLVLGHQVWTQRKTLQDLRLWKMKSKNQIKGFLILTDSYLNRSS